jgi:hypothetical protein
LDLAFIAAPLDNKTVEIEESERATDPSSNNSLEELSHAWEVG